MRASTVINPRDKKERQCCYVNAVDAEPIIDNVSRFLGWMRTTICARTTKYFCCGGTWTFKSFFDNRTNLLFCGSHSQFSSSLRPVTRKNFSFTKRLFVRKPFHFYSAARSAAEKAFLNDQEEEYDCTSRDKMLIVAEKKTSQLLQLTQSKLSRFNLLFVYRQRK